MTKRDRPTPAVGAALVASAADALTAALAAALAVPGMSTDAVATAAEAGLAAARAVAAGDVAQGCIAQARSAVAIARLFASAEPVALAPLALVESALAATEVAVALPAVALARPSERTFADMLRRMRGRMHAVGDRLVSGEIGAQDFGEYMYTVLLNGHEEAWRMGRGRAGDLAPDPNDFYHARQAADQETNWSRRFVAQIEDGWGRDAEGEWREGMVRNRLDLYVLKMRGTAGRAFVATSDVKAMYNWVLGATELHCTDCPQLAAMSPWQSQHLWTYPGDGATICLGNCLCFLEREDGITSFKPVMF